MIKTYADAKEYVGKIKGGLVNDPFASKDFAYSLKIFAKAKDEKNFKIVVDFARDFLSKQTK